MPLGDETPLTPLPGSISLKNGAAALYLPMENLTEALQTVRQIVVQPLPYTSAGLVTGCKVNGLPDIKQQNIYFLNGLPVICLHSKLYHYG